MSNSSMPFVMPLNKLPSTKYWERFLAEPQDELLKLISEENIHGDVAKQLFKYFVCIVNVETSTFCNRKCAYCPDALFDRTKQVHLGASGFVCGIIH